MWVAISFNFIKPSFHMSKGVSSRDIIDQQCSYSTPVVGSRNRSKVLLASSIPNLKFDSFITNCNGFSSKFYPDGDIMSCSCFILNKLKDNTRFAHTCIAYDYEFEEVIIVVHGCYLV